MKRRNVLKIMAATAATAHLPSQASGPFPSRAVRFVVPYPAGGGGDILVRVVAKNMTASLGQSVYVENKPGASGQIGIGDVVRSAPDGHTIVLSSIGPMSVSPHIVKTPYDPLKDLQAVAMLGSADGLLVVRPDFPARNVAELVEYVKRNPKMAVFGSPAQAGPNYLASVLFQKAAGIEMVHIPYNGDGPGIVDVLSGNVPVYFPTMGSVLTHIKSGKLRVIATLGAKRSRFTPDAPTFVESGYPNLVYTAWFGVYAPPGTPPALVSRLNESINSALRHPEVIQTMADIGYESGQSTPEELAAWTNAEFNKWGRVIKEAGIKPEGAASR